jgi:hypothetical protein
MNDHLISLLLLMLLNRFQLMRLLLARVVVLHLTTNVGINARIVLIHFRFDV